LPVTVPVKGPLNEVAVTIPPLIVTPVPTLSVEKVEIPLEFIFPVRFPTKLLEFTIPPLIVTPVPT